MASPIGSIESLPRPRVAGAGRRAPSPDGRGIPGSITPEAAPPSDRQLETRKAFQAFVAGTFYKQMLRSLRQSLDKPAYFHGGQAEETFQAQLDQQVAEDLAASRGGALADDLYDAFLRRRS